MRWPWRRRDTTPPVPAPPPPNLAKACADLQAVVAQRPEVEQLRRRLQQHRQMNGFADLVFRPTRGRR